LSRLPPILCISNMAWDATLPTNRQQLMRRFAARTPVAVVEAPLPILGSLVGQSRKRIRHHGWRCEGEVAVLQAWDWAPYPVAQRSNAVSAWVDAAFRRYIRTEWERLGWGAPLLWLYPPDSADLLGVVGERLALYHCVDDYAASQRYVGYQRVAPYSPAKREQTLVEAADLLIVTSPPLYQHWSAHNPNAHLLPNVADTALFAQSLQPAPEHPALAGIPQPRVGYIGALDAYKVDFGLLEGLARRCPHIQFVCVGPVGIGDGTHARALPRASNLHYLGALPQAELPAVLRGCSACLIPYAINDYTRGVSPLKLYEYLAAGQPVVASALPALQAEQTPGVLLADPSPASFAACLLRAMQTEPSARLAIAQHAQSHSWERRVEQLEELILDRLAEKSASIRTGLTTNKADA
jgi:glycosyltransferase involved in cell wall biosynthesis